MCFKISRRNNSAKIARTDIPCLKVLTVSTTTKKTKLKSPSYMSKRTYWEVNKIISVPNITRLVTSTMNISIGLHSKKSWTGTLPWRSITRNVYPAIIPAGSIYWENNTEYVSENLKIISDIPLNKTLAEKHLKLTKSKK